MKILAFFSCLLLCSAAPTPNHLSTVVVTNAVFKEKFVIHTSQHDIVNIYVPVNRNNFPTLYPHVWFFVEVDKNNGERVDQGLYVYKNRIVTKLFNKGRDVVADNENVIYFGASDGIYKYNEALNTAEKYGTVNDSIIQMASNRAKNVIYYLTTNNEVFKLNSDATSVKLPLKNVQTVVFGFEGNMYYMDTEKNVYVLSDVPNSTPRKIAGLPSTINKITLFAPMSGMGDGALLLVDKSVYVIKPDATVSRKFVPGIAVDIEVELSAYGPQPTMLQLYAKDKKLYEYNLFTMEDELRSLIGL